MRSIGVAVLALLICSVSLEAADFQQRFRLHPHLPEWVINYSEDRQPGNVYATLSVTSADGRTYVELEPDVAVGEVVPPSDNGAVPWLVTLDLNFDGYQDLLLLAWHSEETGSTRRVVWTYVPSRHHFEYQPLLSQAYNLDVDPRTRTVRSEHREEFQSPVIERKSWQWLDGRLRLTRTENQAWNSRRRCFQWTVVERVGGVMRQTMSTCRVTPVVK